MKNKKLTLKDKRQIHKDVKKLGVRETSIKWDINITKIEEIYWAGEEALKGR